MSQAYNKVMQKKTKILIGATFAVAYLAVFFGYNVFSATIRARSSGGGNLQVSFLNIGQGDSIYIKAPNGKDMLIDGARTGAVLSKKLKNVMAPGDNAIDVVMATHPDADHIGGLQSTIEKYSVGEFIEPGVGSKTKTYLSLLDAVSNKKVPHMYARTGTVITLDEKNHITFTVLAPMTVYEGEDTNDASIVGILSSGNERFMFTGDVPIAIEEEIMRETKVLGTNISANVLKLGHHGSRTSSSENFLRTVHPETAVISAGCDNSYGHPHKETLDRLAILRIQYLLTCTLGTITFTTDGLTLKSSFEK